jgi:hypothetical protein
MTAEYEDKLVKCLGSLAKVIEPYKLDDVLKMRVKDFIINVAATKELSFRLPKKKG